MNTKTCKNCGWVLSKKDPRYTCPACRRAFTEGICKVCHKYSYSLRTHQVIGVCLDCYRKSTSYFGTLEAANNYYRYIQDGIAEQYSAWRQRLARKPKTLTEDEWIEACRYFEGCAFCGSEDIDVRSFFVAHRDGGRYYNGNMIPSCEKCHKIRRLLRNPFNRFHRLYKMDQKKLQDIISYLEPRLGGN